MCHSNNPLFPLSSIISIIPLLCIINPPNRVIKLNLWHWQHIHYGVWVVGGWTKYRKNISGVNMIELQNEQLANCRSFDEETFNYPLVDKVRYCLKLICPFWLFPCPRGLSVSGYPLLLVTSPLPPWVSASPSSKDENNPASGPDSILFVKCSPKIWALGKRWKDKCCLPLRERIKQVNFLWLCPVLEFVFPQSTKATIGLDRRPTRSELPCLCPHLIHRIIDGNACLLSTTPFWKSETRDNTPSKEGTSK